MTQKKKFAVIGNPIAHSLSPRIHSMFAEQCDIPLEYGMLTATKSTFWEVVQGFFAEGGAGLNVTLPFKQQALTMADTSSSNARKTGAANMLQNTEQGILATNTDGIGLTTDLASRGKTPPPSSRLLLLGAGGAARGIIPALLRMDPSLLVIANRTMSKAQTLAEFFISQTTADILIATRNPKLVTPNYDMVLNATSFGHSEGEHEGDLPAMMATAIDISSFCYDLSYAAPSADSPPTVFCAAARAAGKEACDGLGMLVHQAAASFTLWHQQEPDADAVLEVLSAEGAKT